MILAGETVPCKHACLQDVCAVCLGDYDCDSNTAMYGRSLYTWSFEASKVVIVAMPCKIQGWKADVDGVVADKPIISKNSKYARGDF
eukprot:356031-Chlamydomonas_euryale.AAC.14